ncbi:MAG TPA: NAD(P)-dependent oxidoreductase [Actinocrinis sp.]|nr:NAD(P)-dependent oxidoreductase [Actinocrinis sp.]
MKVLLAGATGALGIPLTRRLLDAGHEVVGLTRTESGAQRLRGLGARGVLADAMDADGLLRALKGESADAVIHQLTALKKMPMRAKDMELTNRLRTEGTANLLAAAREVGARRFVVQSFFGGYGLGGDQRLITEDDAFAPAGGGPVVDATWQAMASAERQTTAGTDGIEGVVLRYGGFYGPEALRTMAGMLRKRQLPVPRGGGGFASLVYLDDAAAATVAALERGRAQRVYNICDDEPVRWGVMMDQLATVFGTPRPMRLPAPVLRLAAPYAAYLMTRQSLRLSNARAKEELGWEPAFPTYREGVAAGAAGRG